MLTWQQHAAGGLVWISFILFYSIDIIGFIFVGQGVHLIGRMNEKLKNTSRTLITLLGGWICITIVSRIFLVYYCLISGGYTRGYPYTGFLVVQDVGMDHFHYIFSANLYLVTWIIALIFLILVTFQFSRFLRIVDKRVDKQLFMAYCFLNLFSLLCLVVLVVMAPLGEILILEGHIPYMYSIKINNLFIVFFLLKFVIIPLVGILMFNKLRKMKLRANHQMKIKNNFRTSDPRHFH